MSIRLVVVRHGETISNINGIVTGRSNDSLTEHGALQMQKVRKELMDSSCDFTKRFDAVYASPMKRCVESAQILVPEYTPIYDDRLAERDLGELKDYSIDQLWEKPLWNSLDVPRMPEGAETLLSGINRVRDFLEDLEKKYKGKDVEILVITHSFISRCMWIILNKITDEKMMAGFTHKNDEIKEWIMLEKKS
jgi:broad specificity phosphatase PhoE